MRVSWGVAPGWDEGCAFGATEAPALIQPFGATEIPVPIQRSRVIPTPTASPHPSLGQRPRFIARERASANGAIHPRRRVSPRRSAHRTRRASFRSWGLRNAPLWGSCASWQERGGRRIGVQHANLRHPALPRGECNSEVLNFGTRERWRLDDGDAGGFQRFDPSFCRNLR